MPRPDDMPKLGRKRVNKCSNFSRNPADLTNVTKTGDVAATLAVVDDTTELNKVGLTGNAFKLDNSAGSATATAVIGGQAGVTLAGTISAYVRGTGSGRITYSSTGGGVTATLPASYALVSQKLQSTKTGDQLTIEAQAGAVIFFIDNVSEEGTSITAPRIPVAGAAATRFS